MKARGDVEKTDVAALFEADDAARCRHARSSVVLPVELVFGAEPHRVRVKCLAEVPAELAALVQREIGLEGVVGGIVSSAEVEQRLARLSRSERQVLDHLVDGLTNRQIAERMFLAPKTVKNYVSSLLSKLEMTRRTEAAVLGARLRDARSMVVADGTVVDITSRAASSMSA
jgi:DNA-binding NarL/FixJ family response regulator